jgi:hypothetical protein
MMTMDDDHRVGTGATSQPLGRGAGPRGGEGVLMQKFTTDTFDLRKSESFQLLSERGVRLGSESLTKSHMTFSGAPCSSKPSPSPRMVPPPPNADPLPKSQERKQ